MWRRGRRGWPSSPAALVRHPRRHLAATTGREDPEQHTFLSILLHFYLFLVAFDASPAGPLLNLTQCFNGHTSLPSNFHISSQWHVGAPTFQVDCVRGDDLISATRLGSSSIRHPALKYRAKVRRHPGASKPRLRHNKVKWFRGRRSVVVDHAYLVV